MWPRLQIDLDWADLLAACGYCVVPAGRGYAIPNLCEPVKPSDQQETAANQWLACQCERTGFDLLLQALNLPRGSEVAFTALTIPDMPRIAEENGLVAIPVDLEADSNVPSVDSLERAISPATRAVVVAHLFGTRIDIRPLIAVARRHNLLVIEDAAQAYDGSRWFGHKDADVAMFSFGPIKSATSLGGGLLRINDSDLYQKMVRLHCGYPQQRRAVFVKRILKYGTMKLFSYRATMGCADRICNLLGYDLDSLLVNAARGYRGGDIMSHIRYQPAPPLWHLMKRRSQQNHADRLRKRAQVGRLLSSLIDVDYSPELDDTFWVFPVLPRGNEHDVSRLLNDLRRAGFDVTMNCRLSIVDTPDNCEELFPQHAHELLRRMMFLPIYAELSPQAIRRMATICRGRVDIVRRSPRRQELAAPTRQSMIGTR